MMEPQWNLTEHKPQKVIQLGEDYTKLETITALWKLWQEQRLGQQSTSENCRWAEFRSPDR